MVAKLPKIKLDCWDRQSRSSGPRSPTKDPMPALPPTPSTSSPEVTSTLGNTDVLAEGLKKFTPAETSPHTSSRLSLRMKLVSVEVSVMLRP